LGTLNWIVKGSRRRCHWLEKIATHLSASGIACQSGRNAYSNLVRINELKKLFLDHILDSSYLVW